MKNLMEEFEFEATEEQEAPEFAQVVEAEFIHQFGTLIFQA